MTRKLLHTILESGTAFYHTEDYRYIIQREEDNALRGYDVLTEKATKPSEELDSILEEMSTEFGESFSVVNEASAKALKQRANDLSLKGYTVVYDMTEPELTVLDRNKKTVYKAVGSAVDKLVNQFSRDPASSDTALSFEDYILANFV